MPGPTRKKIGSYDLERELGRGGMGVVHLARQAALDRAVVIKSLRRDLVTNEDTAERFTREARAAAGIHHQNVVGVYDSFRWRGECFIVQEYVAGEDLGEVLQSVGRLEPRIASLVALELARGLEEIHACGVVHRDLKPRNVLLSRRGEAKIGDFGIALEPSGSPLTGTGVAIGTPTHMAPELHRGERADPRSDLYAFGVLLFEMLTAELPYAPRKGDAAADLVRLMESGRHASLRSLAPATPRRLARLVNACLRPRARRRPAGAASLREALEHLCGRPSPVDCRNEIADWLWQRDVFQSEGDETLRLAPISPRTDFRRRRLGWVAAVAAATAVMAGVGAVRLGVLPVPLPDAAPAAAMREAASPVVDGNVAD